MDLLLGSELPEQVNIIAFSSILAGLKLEKTVNYFYLIVQFYCL
jgi:hypothetical protein